MRVLPSATLDLRREIKRCSLCGRRFSRDATFCPFDGVKLVDATFDALGDPLVGATVEGRYQVLEVLGEGGMGRVYRVRHAALERVFAMKVLRRDLAQDSALGGRFIREAKATASIRHPNVVQITDFGRLPEEIPFFVMELLCGETLARALRVGPMPPARAVSIIKPIARALGAAHAAGVVHRDLKPENVFLVSSRGGSGDAPRADVRVVDFGAAKIIGASRITRAGVVFGTPHYMSPEQASGQSVNHSADIYALGVIIYEMLAGRVPFRADTFMGVLSQHMFERPTPPSEVSMNARGASELETIALRCLEKKPQDRYGSMSHVLDALGHMDEEDPHFSQEAAKPIARRDSEPSPAHNPWIAPPGAAPYSVTPPQSSAPALGPAPGTAARFRVFGLVVAVPLALGLGILGFLLGHAFPQVSPASATAGAGTAPLPAAVAARPSAEVSSSPNRLPVATSTPSAQPPASPPIWPAAEPPADPSARVAPHRLAPREGPAREPGGASGADRLDDVGDPFVAPR